MAQPGPGQLTRFHLDVVLGFLLGILGTVFFYEYPGIKSRFLEPFRRRRKGSGWTPGQDDEDAEE